MLVHSGKYVYLDVVYYKINLARFLQQDIDEK